MKSMIIVICTSTMIINDSSMKPTKKKVRENCKHWCAMCAHRVALNSNSSFSFLARQYWEIAVNGNKFIPKHKSLFYFIHFFFWVIHFYTDYCVVKCAANILKSYRGTSSEEVEKKQLKKRKANLMLSCVSSRTCKNYKNIFSLHFFFAHCNSDILTNSVYDVLSRIFLYFSFFADCQCCFKCYGRRMCNIVKSV